MNRLLPFCIILLLLAATGHSQTGMGVPRENATAGARAEHSAIPAGNSESFFNTPHLLPLSDPGQLFDGMERNIAANNDWILLFILASLFSLAIAKYFFGQRMYMFIRAAIGSNFFNQMNREVDLFSETATYLLYFNFLVVLSLLIWQSAFYFDFVPGSHLVGSLLLFILILLVLTLFYLLKSILLGFLGWVFNSRQATIVYMKNIFLFNQLIGLILLPAVVYFAYSPSYEAMVIIWSLWLAANFVKIFRSAVLGHGHTSFSSYYLILYLCGVELVPFALIIKLGSLFIM